MLYNFIESFGGCLPPLRVDMNASMMGSLLAARRTLALTPASQTATLLRAAGWLLELQSRPAAHLRANMAAAFEATMVDVRANTTSDVRAVLLHVMLRNAVYMLNPVQHEQYAEELLLLQPFHPYAYMVRFRRCGVVVGRACPYPVRF